MLLLLWFSVGRVGRVRKTSPSESESEPGTRALCCCRRWNWTTRTAAPRRACRRCRSCKSWPRSATTTRSSTSSARPPRRRSSRLTARSFSLSFFLSFFLSFSGLHFSGYARGHGQENANGLELELFFSTKLMKWCRFFWKFLALAGGPAVAPRQFSARRRRTKEDRREEVHRHRRRQGSPHRSRSVYRVLTSFYSPHPIALGFYLVLPGFFRVTGHYSAL